MDPSEDETYAKVWVKQWLSVNYKKKPENDAVIDLIIIQLKKNFAFL